MEDQFSGRTDDVLFYDDFEPVESPSVVVYESRPYHSTVQLPPPITLKATGSFTSAATQPTESTVVQTTSEILPDRSLASSRFADKPTAAAANATSTSTGPAANVSPSRGDAPLCASSSSVIPTLSSREHSCCYQRPIRAPSQNTAASGEARLLSGANPRQKLTEEELTAKMEKMKLLAAEKTRKFEMAEKDERQHAEAYARGMEEARRRRADVAERRRHADDERRKLEDERARNRDRKLQAMSKKDGGWDKGKEAAEQVESRPAFRGVNGGIRGYRSGPNPPQPRGSRYAGDAAARPDIDRFLDDRQTSRFRGRSGRAGRRGRGGYSGQNEGPTPPLTVSSAAPDLTADEFPALPSGATAREEETSEGPSAATATPTEATADPAEPAANPNETAAFAAFQIPPAGSKWDDDMEALDATSKDTS